MFTRKQQLDLIALVDDTAALTQALESLACADNGDWSKYANYLLDYIETGIPQFSVFMADGNIKLPFIAFSSLALASCPGAGTCVNYCYSLKGWRYPAALFRQIQNYLIVRDNKELLISEMADLLSKRRFQNRDKIELRLYVDGDIESAETLSFWMENFLPNFPQLAGYGYSKSFDLFLDYEGVWPTNYVLNISDGSIYDGDTSKIDAIKALPITRGEFKAVKLPRGKNSLGKKYSAAKGDYKTKEYRLEVKEVLDYKAFVCPGQCGSCTGKGHACGNIDVSLPIVIGIH